MELLASEQSTVLVYDGDVPTVVGINDGVVYLGINNEAGAPVALIETDEGTVLSWAEKTLGSYRRESSPLSLDRFTELIG